MWGKFWGATGPEGPARHAKKSLTVMPAREESPRNQGSEAASTPLSAAWCHVITRVTGTTGVATTPTLGSNARWRTLTSQASARRRSSRLALVRNSAAAQCATRWFHSPYSPGSSGRTTSAALAWRARKAWSSAQAGGGRAASWAQVVPIRRSAWRRANRVWAATSARYPGKKRMSVGAANDASTDSRSRPDASRAGRSGRHRASTVWLRDERTRRAAAKGERCWAGGEQSGGGGKATAAGAAGGRHAVARRAAQARSAGLIGRCRVSGVPGAHKRRSSGRGLAVALEVEIAKGGLVDATTPVAHVRRLDGWRCQTSASNEKEAGANVESAAAAQKK